MNCSIQKAANGYVINTWGEPVVGASTNGGSDTRERTYVFNTLDEALEKAKELLA